MLVQCQCNISKISLEIWEWGMSDVKKSGPLESVSPPRPPPSRPLFCTVRKRDIPAWLHAGVTDNRARETLPRCSFRQIICWWQHVSLAKALHCFSSEASVAAALTKHTPGNPPCLRPSYSHPHMHVRTCWCVFGVFFWFGKKQKKTCAQTDKLTHSLEERELQPGEKK